MADWIAFVFGVYNYMTKNTIRKSLKGRWECMRRRCYNPKCKTYANYGARGISICKDWIDSYHNFECWALNNGFDIKLSIDRINNDGNYEPSNCRWADSTTQSLNRRKMKNTINTHKGIYEIKDRFLAKPYKAYFYKDYKTYIIGYYKTIEEAIQARENFVTN